MKGKRLHTDQKKASNFIEIFVNIQAKDTTESKTQAWNIHSKWLGTCKRKRRNRFTHNVPYKPFILGLEKKLRKTITLYVIASKSKLITNNSVSGVHSNISSLVLRIHSCFFFLNQVTFLVGLYYLLHCFHSIDSAASIF